MTLRNALISTIVTLLLVLGVSAQQDSPATTASPTPPLVAAAPPMGADPVNFLDDDGYLISFHRPVLKNGKLSRIPQSETVEAGDALSADELNNALSADDLVVIRVTAPEDRYVYVVNNSSWDGVKLTNNGERALAKRSRDFVYKLTNKNNNQTTGTEQFMFIFSQKRYGEDEVKKFKDALSKDAPPKVSTPFSGQGSSIVGKSGTHMVLNITCGILSNFLPGANVACKLFGFGDVQVTSLLGNITGIKPEKEEKPVAVQLSLRVQPKPLDAGK